MESNALMTEVNPLPQKFLFDLAFDGEDGLTHEERAKLAPTYTQEQLEEAKTAAYQEGVEAGRQSVEAQEQKRASAFWEQMASHIEALHKNAAEEWHRQLGQLQMIAVSIARKILPTYMAQNGSDEIETILRRIIAEMNQEPRLVVRLAESQFDEMSAKINAIAAERAFAGKLVILADAEMGPSDCRVEWADGGIERDVSALWQEIDKVMQEVQTDETALTPQEEPQTPVSGENA